MTIQALYPTVRPTLNLDFAKTKALDPRITFSRASTATFVGSNGLIQTAASGAARFDHNPTTGESLGLLVEEARTNIIVSSSVFNTGSWVQDGVVLTTNAGVAPDGTTTATSVSQGTGSNRSFHFDNTGAGSKTLTVFAKSNAGSSITLSGNLAYGSNFVGSAVLSTANGTVSTALGCSSVALPNGWYRFIIPINVTNGSGNTNYLSINGPASSVFLWGVQIEAGAFPTSYIPTTTATVTRAADVASMTGTNFSSWYNQSQGTLFCSFPTAKQDASASTLSIVALNNNSVTEHVGISRSFDPLQLNVSIVTGYATQSSFTFYPIPYGIKKVALGFAANNSTCVVNGTTSAVDTSISMPSPNQLLLGTNTGYTNYALNGTIARLAYYPVRLPDAQLQALTAT
jgi:hypothetical protein